MPDDFFKSYQNLVKYKRKLWSSGRALSSQSEGCGFNPYSMLDGSNVSHARINSYAQFWFIKEKKWKIQVAKWGTPKKYFFKIW